MRKVERKRMNPEHKKYFLVGSLCIAMFLMLGIGYAVLSQQLDINGTLRLHLIGKYYLQVQKRKK